MKKTLDFEKIPARCLIIFYINVIESLFILIGTIILFYAVARPILFYATPYLNGINLKEKSGNELTDILVESNLAEYDKKTNVLSTVDSLYSSFVYKNIKYCYESYKEIYKENLDEYGYETKLDFFNSVEEINYQNDNLGYFYTEYIIGKLDVNGDLIINIDDSNKYNYFIYEVLDIDEEGSKFFEYDKNDLSIYPHLKLDVCRYLFQYHLMDVSYSTLRDTDNEFYNYFKDRYKEAGNYLLMYSDYEENLSLYNNLYDKTELNLLSTSILSYVGSLFIFSFIIPLCFKDKETLSLKLFKCKRLNKKDKSTYLNYFLDGLKSFLYNFYTLLFSLFIFGGTNLLNIHFLEVGVFTFNSLHLILLSLIVNMISLLILLIKKNSQGLFSLITKTKYFENILIKKI